MLKKLRKIKDKFDMSKNPEFKIYKPFFQGSLALILALFVLAVLLDGTGVLYNARYAECPEESLSPCQNPFFEEGVPPCQAGSIGIINPSCEEFLAAGALIGEKPSFLSSNFLFFVVIILSVTVIINYRYAPRLLKKVKR